MGMLIRSQFTVQTEPNDGATAEGSQFQSMYVGNVHPVPGYGSSSDGRCCSMHPKRFSRTEHNIIFLLSSYCSTISAITVSLSAWYLFYNLTFKTISNIRQPTLVHIVSCYDCKRHMHDLLYTRLHRGPWARRIWAVESCSGRLLTWHKQDVNVSCRMRLRLGDTWVDLSWRGLFALVKRLVNERVELNDGRMSFFDCICCASLTFRLFTFSWQYC